MDCIFCQIAKHEIPTSARFEDDEFIAFDDINPKAAVHILVIPKSHVRSVATLENSDQEMAGRLIMVAKQVAAKAGLDSYRLVFNSGKDAGQEVDHIHLHILGGEKLGNIA